MGAYVRVGVADTVSSLAHVQRHGEGSQVRRKETACVSLVATQHSTRYAPQEVPR